MVNDIMETKTVKFTVNYKKSNIVLVRCFVKKLVIITLYWICFGLQMYGTHFIFVIFFLTGTFVWICGKISSYIAPTAVFKLKHYKQNIKVKLVLIVHN